MCVRIDTMFKPTKAKLILFGILLVLIFAPLFLIGGGLTVLLPVCQIFWLAGLAQALGLPVVSNRVDAFSLAAPNVLCDTGGHWLGHFVGV